jgi:hypothetical protein
MLDMRFMHFVASAALAQATLASPAAVSPECGSIERNIGRGFILTQRMYGGSRAFELRFLPPASAIHTNGVKLTGPFEVMINNFGDNFDLGVGPQTLNGPDIGLYFYGVRGPSGNGYTGTIRVDCGGGTFLRFRTTLSTTDPGVPNNFPGMFVNQPQQRCLSELMQNGRLELTVSEPEGSPPGIAISSPYPLRWALDLARAIWARQTEDFKGCRCRMKSPLQPPF